MRNKKKLPETEYQHHFNNPENPPYKRKNPFAHKWGFKLLSGYVIDIAIILGAVGTAVWFFLNLFN